MAHDCPECGELCFCNGDIDDCIFNFPEYQMNCIHCFERNIEDADEIKIIEETPDEE